MCVEKEREKKTLRYEIIHCREKKKKRGEEEEKEEKRRRGKRRQKIHKNLSSCGRQGKL